MTDAQDIVRRLEMLADREAIRDRILRCAHATDRHDRPELERQYWPEAEEDHISFAGPVKDFMDFAFRAWADMNTQHLVGNILIDLVEPGVARCESYYVATHDMPAPIGRQEVILRGRYLDRFEKRGGEWRIIKRVLTCDHLSIAASSADWTIAPLKSLKTRGGHYPDDPYYRFMGE